MNALWMFGPVLTYIKDLLCNNFHLNFFFQIKGKVEINWSTPLQKLPFSVVKVLQRLDVDSKWKDLAAQTGTLLQS